MTNNFFKECFVFEYGTDYQHIKDIKWEIYQEDIQMSRSSFAYETKNICEL